MQVNGAAFDRNVLIDAEEGINAQSADIDHWWRAMRGKDEGEDGFAPGHVIADGNVFVDLAGVFAHGL